MTKSDFGKIRNASVWVILILLLSGFDAGAMENSLQKGSWSLQFEINGDLKPGGYQGTIFSLKRQYTNRSAVRLGLSLDANTIDSDDEEQRVDGIDSAKHISRYNMTDESDKENVEIAGQYIFYPSPGADVNLFFGLGPHLKYTRQRSANSYYRGNQENAQTSRSEYEYSSEIWTFGGATALGVEWFFLKKFSLLAEYGLFLDYEHTKSTRSESTLPESYIFTQKTSKDGFYLRPLSVRFGLAFYFK